MVFLGFGLGGFSLFSPTVFADPVDLSYGDFKLISSNRLELHDKENHFRILWLVFSHSLDTSTFKDIEVKYNGGDLSQPLFIAQQGVGGEMLSIRLGFSWNPWEYTIDLSQLKDKDWFKIPQSQQIFSFRVVGTEPSSCEPWGSPTWFSSKMTTCNDVLLRNKIIDGIHYNNALLNTDVSGWTFYQLYSWESKTFVSLSPFSPLLTLGYDPTDLVNDLKNFTCPYHCDVNAKDEGKTVGSTYACDAPHVSWCREYCWTNCFVPELNAANTTPDFSGVLPHGKFTTYSYQITSPAGVQIGTGSRKYFCSNGNITTWATTIVCAPGYTPDDVNTPTTCVSNQQGLCSKKFQNSVLPVLPSPSTVLCDYTSQSAVTPSNGTHWTWTWECMWDNSVNASCSAYKKAECKKSGAQLVLNECAIWDVNNIQVYWDATHWRYNSWECKGWATTMLEDDILCQIPTAPTCDTSVQYGCKNAIAINKNSTGCWGSSTWTCQNPADGSTSAPCTMPNPTCWLWVCKIPPHTNVWSAAPTGTLCDSSYGATPVVNTSTSNPRTWTWKCKGNDDTVSSDDVDCVQYKRWKCANSVTITNWVLDVSTACAVGTYHNQSSSSSASGYAYTWYCEGTKSSSHEDRSWLCKVLECNSGYHEAWGVCVSDTQTQMVTCPWLSVSDAVFFNNSLSYSVEQHRSWNELTHSWSAWDPQVVAYATGVLSPVQNTCQWKCKPWFTLTPDWKSCQRLDLCGSAVNTCKYGAVSDGQWTSPLWCEENTFWSCEKNGITQACYKQNTTECPNPQCNPRYHNNAFWSDGLWSTNPPSSFSILCSVGSVYSLHSGTDRWTWKCKKWTGTVSCNATKLKWACGYRDNTEVSGILNGNDPWLCQQYPVGNKLVLNSFKTTANGWIWKCAGPDGVQPQICSAKKKTIPVLPQPACITVQWYFQGYESSPIWTPNSNPSVIPNGLCVSGTSTYPVIRNLHWNYWYQWECYHAENPTPKTCTYPIKTECWDEPNTCKWGHLLSWSDLGACLLNGNTRYMWTCENASSYGTLRPYHVECAKELACSKCTYSPSINRDGYRLLNSDAIASSWLSLAEGSQTYLYKPLTAQWGGTVRGYRKCPLTCGKWNGGKDENLTLWTDIHQSTLGLQLDPGLRVASFLWMVAYAGESNGWWWALQMSALPAIVRSNYTRYPVSTNLFGMEQVNGYRSFKKTADDDFYGFTSDLCSIDCEAWYHAVEHNGNYYCDPDASVPECGDNEQEYPSTASAWPWTSSSDFCRHGTVYVDGNPWTPQWFQGNEVSISWECRTGGFPSDVCTATKAGEFQKVCPTEALFENPNISIEEFYSLPSDFVVGTQRVAQAQDFQDDMGEKTCIFSCVIDPNSLEPQVKKERCRGELNAPNWHAGDKNYDHDYHPNAIYSGAVNNGIDLYFARKNCVLKRWLQGVEAGTITYSKFRNHVVGSSPTDIWASNEWTSAEWGKDLGIDVGYGYGSNVISETKSLSSFGGEDEETFSFSHKTIFSSDWWRLFIDVDDEWSSWWCIADTDNYWVSSQIYTQVSSYLPSFEHSPYNVWWYPLTYNYVPDTWDAPLFSKSTILYWCQADLLPNPDKYCMEKVTARKDWTSQQRKKYKYKNLYFKEFTKFYPWAITVNAINSQFDWFVFDRLSKSDIKHVNSHDDTLSLISLVTPYRNTNWWNRIYPFWIPGYSSSKYVIPADSYISENDETTDLHARSTAIFWNFYDRVSWLKGSSWGWYNAYILRKSYENGTLVSKNIYSPSKLILSWSFLYPYDSSNEQSIWGMLIPLKEQNTYFYFSKMRQKDNLNPYNNGITDEDSYTFVFIPNANTPSNWITTYWVKEIFWAYDCFPWYGGYHCSGSSQ